MLQFRQMFNIGRRVLFERISAEVRSYIPQILDLLLVVPNYFGNLSLTGVILSKKPRVCGRGSNRDLDDPARNKKFTQSY